MSAKLQRRCIICRKRKIENIKQEKLTKNYAESKLFAECTLIRLVCKQFALFRRHRQVEQQEETRRWVNWYVYPYVGVCVCVCVLYLHYDVARTPTGSHTLQSAHTHAPYRHVIMDRLLMKPTQLFFQGGYEGRKGGGEAQHSGVDGANKWEAINMRLQGKCHEKRMRKWVK